MTPISSSPTRIIVADDHEWIRSILMDIVRQTLPDADVVETADGAQAWEAFQQGGCHFLVSNHFMPNMDGMGLIRRVRERTPHLPIVMVCVKPEAKEDAMAAGADWFLTKKQIMEGLPPLLRRHARPAGDAAS